MEHISAVLQRHELEYCAKTRNKSSCLCRGSVSTKRRNKKKHVRSFPLINLIGNSSFDRVLRPCLMVHQSLSATGRLAQEKQGNWCAGRQWLEDTSQTILLLSTCHLLAYANFCDNETICFLCLFDTKILSQSDLQSRLPFDAVREAAPLNLHRWLPCSLVSFCVIPKTTADL